jgi:hypothetical protein
METKCEGASGACRITSSGKKDNEGYLSVDGNYTAKPVIGDECRKIKR